jgi:LPS export ABC transporter protein LptC/lipopolysaccharide transport protein LptA
MGNRKIVIYIFIGCIISSLVLALYFFVRKPDKIIPPVIDEEKKVIVFKEVKYSGEKKGVVDWEIRAKVARKYIDKPLIELETLTGLYKPKDGVVVQFKGTKGSMDTDKESGSVEDVDVLYKNEYTLKSTHMDFDFKIGTTTTKALVNITGKKLTMSGIGLTANTNQETVKLESAVSGTMETGGAKYDFRADTLTYYFKDDFYVLQGKVIFKGEDMNLSCGKLLIYSSGQELERVEAYDKVNIISKGTIAKSEKAVYHFKEGKIVFTNSPRVLKDNVEMKGESIEYDTGSKNISVKQPKMRLAK